MTIERTPVQQTRQQPIFFFCSTAKYLSLILPLQTYGCSCERIVRMAFPVDSTFRLLQ